MAICLLRIGACPSLHCCSILKVLTCLLVCLYRVSYQDQGGSELGFFDARFGDYLAVAALLIVTPGPDTALVTRHALLSGGRAGSFTTLGIGAGNIIWALASALGIVVLLEDSVVAFRQELLNNLFNPKAGAIFATALPQFIRSSDPQLRLARMLLAYEAILLNWLNLYGYVFSRAGQSRFGTRIRAILQGVTGIVFIALGVRLCIIRLHLRWL
jgi:threonine/homoserine/homoserine lactone efflux protein